MVRNGIFDQHASLPRQPHAKAKINIFYVTKKVFVKATYGLEDITAIQGRRRTWRKDLPVSARRLRLLRPVPVSPYETAHMIDIAFPVNYRGVIRRHQPTGKTRILGILMGCVDKLLQPVRRGECIGINQRNPLTVPQMAHRDIICRGKADVFLKTHVASVFRAPAQQLGYLGLAAVINNDGTFNLRFLCCKGIETSIEQVK